ncbi:MAG TPA: hypothetical protein VN943_00730 [Candidatus Acidoferrum sp.]|nr:hypothetical protein [Candidatus Acidoferrum sp.]
MATHPPATIKLRDRFFYVAMAVVAASLVFAGFARTYYLRHFFTNASLKPLLHLHGFLFTSWLILLLVQVTLVAAKRTDLHRRLGVAGGVLASLMIVVGPITAIHSARGEFTPNAPDPLRFLVVPLFDILVFAIVVGAGLYYRTQPQTHKRLMLVATFALLPAAVSRLPLGFIQNAGPLVFFGVNDLLLLACIAYDTVEHRRLHPAYLWSGLLLIVSHPARLALGGTSAWLAFAHWLTR